LNLSHLLTGRENTLEWLVREEVSTNCGYC
jgi:hypothetical protein